MVHVMLCNKPPQNLVAHNSNNYLILSPSFWEGWELGKGLAQQVCLGPHLRLETGKLKHGWGSLSFHAVWGPSHVIPPHGLARFLVVVAKWASHGHRDSSEVCVPANKAEAALPFMT